MHKSGDKISPVFEDFPTRQLTQREDIYALSFLMQMKRSYLANDPEQMKEYYMCFPDEQARLSVFFHMIGCFVIQTSLTLGGVYYYLDPEQLEEEPVKFHVHIGRFFCAILFHYKF
jgi:hypothetical protein